jgi:hypothetical protein
MAALSEDCLYKGEHILDKSTASIFGVKMGGSMFHQYVGTCVYSTQHPLENGDFH